MHFQLISFGFEAQGPWSVLNPHTVHAGCKNGTMQPIVHVLITLIEKGLTFLINHAN